MKKQVKYFAGSVLLLFSASLVFVWYIGAWNLLFTPTHYDTEAPEIPDNLLRPAILLFSKTNGYRHKDGIEAGRHAFKEIADQRAMDLFHTDNGAIFNQQDLNKFNVVVFLNATGDMLSQSQKLTFQNWLENGGGWLGLHAAGDSSHNNWSWYMDNLIGVEFTAHIMGPQFQEATIITENQKHPVNTGLPDQWSLSDEWYSWKSSPREKGFSILARLNEDSYQPVQNLFGKKRDLRMGDHPIVWASCVEKGKTIYSAIGHRGEVFDDDRVRTMLSNAIGWLSDYRCTSDNH